MPAKAEYYALVETGQNQELRQRDGNWAYTKYRVVAGGFNRKQVYEYAKGLGFDPDVMGRTIAESYLDVWTRELDRLCEEWID